MTVAWNESHPVEKINKLRRRYGNGPFHIERVRLISPHCSCGLLEDDQGHYPRCVASALPFAKHPQVLYLKTEQQGKALDFSAIFFQPVEGTS